MAEPQRVAIRPKITVADGGEIEEFIQSKQPKGYVGGNSLSKIIKENPVRRIRQSVWFVPPNRLLKTIGEIVFFFSVFPQKKKRIPIRDRNDHLSTSFLSFSSEITRDRGVEKKEQESFLRRIGLQRPPRRTTTRWREPEM